MTSDDRPTTWDGRVLDPSAILLTDRVVLVTGAAQGIGKATAIACARFGADLAICDRLAPAMEATADEIRSIGRDVVTAELDVRDEAAVAAWLPRVAEHYGRVDVLVNNAGGTFWSPFLDVSTKGELAIIRENFTSVTGLIRGVVPLMADGGSIVNVTSIEAHRAGPGFAVYSAMKAAVANLTMSLSMELGPSRIRVNCIAPDVIPTEGDSGLADASGALEALPVEESSWPEGGSVHDCAAAIVYLASDMSRFVTGSTVHVNGGNLAAGGWKLLSDGGYAL